MEKGSGREHERLSEVRKALPDRCPNPAGPTARRQSVRDVRRGHRIDRPAEVRGSEYMNGGPKCIKHFWIVARSRLAQLLEDNQYETCDGDIASTDPLKFVDLK